MVPMAVPPVLVGWYGCHCYQSLSTTDSSETRKQICRTPQICFLNMNYSCPVYSTDLCEFTILAATQLIRDNEHRVPQILRGLHIALDPMLVTVHKHQGESFVS